MDKLLCIRLVCLNTGCQELITEFDILKEDSHTMKISMADQTGATDSRTIKKKWIGEITQYAIGNGIELKIMCLPQDRASAISDLKDSLIDYIEQKRRELACLDSAISEYTT